ncbi:ROK family protein [Ponticaulis profundi]|uniref:ROK family protein n=1 Tax=Ponticaulis profundi TaxID=2665222 RepID=A0ABW1SCF2_9PROT
MSNETEHDSLAGIFFADDANIWATGRSISGHEQDQFGNYELSFQPNFVDREEVNALRIKPAETVKKDVEAIVSAMADHTEISELKIVTTASLGPFKENRTGFNNSGKIIHAPRAEKWAAIDLHKIVSDTFEEFGNKNITVRCLHDAEAFVIGEHYLQRQMRLKRDKIGSEAYRKDERALAQETVAYFLLDQGVGGAVLRNNSFVRGETALEFGHLPIYPAFEDEHRFPISDCGAHSLPCLEGTVSIEALAKKWKLTLDDYLQLPADAEALHWIGYYVAQAIHMIVLTHSPTTFFLGGRLVNNEYLVPHVRGFYDVIGRNRRNGRMYPGYDSQYKLGKFIKRWTFPDTGVLGCLCWSRKQLDAATNPNVFQFP